METMNKIKEIKKASEKEFSNKDLQQQMEVYHPY
jgi:hypothetical protein